jgi:hypothetical protein
MTRAFAFHRTSYKSTKSSLSVVRKSRKFVIGQQESFLDVERRWKILLKHIIANIKSSFDKST